MAMLTKIALKIETPRDTVKSFENVLCILFARINILNIRSKNKAKIIVSPTFGGVGFDEGVSMASQFVIQAKSVGVTIVWCAIATFVLYKIVNSVVGMRVSDESERTGLDTTSHGETAYHS